MQTKKRPATLGRRETGQKQKKDFYNRRSHLTTAYPKTSKQKIHWSRHPEQREQDRALLALFGLAFERVPGTSFHRLCGKGV